MAAMVIKPVQDCETCQQNFTELKTFYSLHKTQPRDPGAIGLLQASLDAYNAHHATAHPIHPEQQEVRP